MIRLLETEGWVQVSTEGSHRQFKHPEKPGRVTVSGAMGDDMPKGTQYGRLSVSYRTMLLTTDPAGLRLNEMLHLRVGDLDVRSS